MRLVMVKFARGVGKAAANPGLVISTRLPAALLATSVSMSTTSTGLAPLASHARRRAFETRFCPQRAHPQLDGLTAGVPVHAADHLLDLHEVKRGGGGARSQRRAWR